jgi:guanylate kinase
MGATEGKVFIFSAPSGGGKTTIVNRVLSANKNFSFSVSATTRPIRGHEQHGREYFFITVDEFKKRMAEGEFLESEEVYPGRFYGTLKTEVERMWKEGKCALFDVDVKGGVSIKKYYGANACSFFIEPPSLEVLRQRLTARGTDSAEEIERRLAKAGREMEFAPQFDHKILNDSLDRAVAEVQSIIDSFLKT